MRFICHSQSVSCHTCSMPQVWNFTESCHLSLCRCFQHHVTCVNFILTRHQQLVLFGWAKVISPNCSYFKIGIIVKYGHAIRLQPSTSSPGSPLTTGGEKRRDPGNEFIMYKPKLSLQQNMPMPSFNIPILKTTGLWWWKMCLTTVCNGKLCLHENQNEKNKPRWKLTGWVDCERSDKRRGSCVECASVKCASVEGGTTGVCWLRCWS